MATAVVPQAQPASVPEDLHRSPRRWLAIPQLVLFLKILTHDVLRKYLNNIRKYAGGFTEPSYGVDEDGNDISDASIEAQENMKLL
jgi:hypothetical protein